MTAKQVTAWPTEADLEAEIHGVIKHVFPWLPSDSVRHQTKFSFKFGHKVISVNGAEASKAVGRSDVILYLGEKPLTVLELKRKGLALTAEDFAQGLSYARVLNPWPPLVVVTNGVDTRLLETHSGKEWKPPQPSQEAFRALVANAAVVATTDTKFAIDTLMGTNPAVWMQAIRHVSAQTISDLSASWDEPGHPFVRNFLIARKATGQALEELGKGSKLILVEGPPLAGKSSVLRDICVRTEQHLTISTLYVEGGVGHGILQSLADALRHALDWPVSKDEARDWLARISRSDEHRLLLAVDGLDTRDSATRSEVEDLTSSTFGPGLALVVTLDDATADKAVLAPDGLTESAIGRRSKRVCVEALDDAEFQEAQSALWKHRIGFMHGAYATPEFRQPWVLRAMSAPLLERIGQSPPDRVAMLPPMLSLKLIARARERFKDPEVRRLFKAIAAAAIDDGKDRTRDPSLILESIEVNLVRRAQLRKHLEEGELNWLVDHGFVKPAIHACGVPILLTRVPELLASEIAFLLADELAPLTRTDPVHAAEWLAGAAGNFPMGDVIAAQAIYDATQRPGSIDFNLIMSLLEKPPKRGPVSAGSRFATHIPGIGIVEMKLNVNGTADVEIDGIRHILELGDDGITDTYTDVYPWLILSHLAAIPFALEGENGVTRVDPEILLAVGQCDIALRKPGGSPAMHAAPTHDVPGVGSIVCHEAGIIEPVTLSIFRFLMYNDSSVESWIDSAVDTESAPLIARVHIALRELSSSADEARSSWARRMLDTKIVPAFKLLPSLHDN